MKFQREVSEVSTGTNEVSRSTGENHVVTNSLLIALVKFLESPTKFSMMTMIQQLRNLMTEVSGEPTKGYLEVPTKISTEVPAESLPASFN